MNTVQYNNAGKIVQFNYKYKLHGMNQKLVQHGSFAFNRYHSNAQIYTVLILPHKHINTLYTIIFLFSEQTLGKNTTKMLMVHLL